MAATNFTPIQLYHSTTASAVPVNTNLVNGELAINIADGKLYYKDSGGTVQVIASKATGTIGGSTTQVQYNSSGSLAGSANFTFNGTTATINTLNLTNALGAAYGGTAQSTYTQGDLLYASAANTLSKLAIGSNTYILTSNGTIPGWAAPSSISVNTATNLAGGAGGSVPYQSGAGATTFLSIGTANQVMTSSGSLPQWSSGLSITTLTASDAVTFSATTQNIDLGTSQTSGNITIGGTAQTGALAFGQSTKTTVVSIGVGATENAATKTINIGTFGVSGSTTTITIGSTNGTTTTLNGTVTAATLNSTTIDLTNLEVTNIKAKDGTASITLADSTGQATFSANPLLNAGTANGVPYLNASKVLTTGSALTFDGTRLGIGSSANTEGMLTVGTGTVTDKNGIVLYRGAASSVSATQVAIFNELNGIGSGESLTLRSPAGFKFQNNDGSSEWMRLTTTGLGIGTSSPTAAKLHIAGYNGGSVYPIRMTSTNSGVEWAFETGGTNAATSFLAIRDIGNSATRMTLDSSGNLGIGTSSIFGVLNLQTSTNARFEFTSASTVGSLELLNNARNAYLDYDVYASTHRWRKLGSVAMTLDSSGNLGLGVTPSAWSGYTGLQVKATVIGGIGTSDNALFGSNVFYDGANFKYINSTTATLYRQLASSHLWLTAPSGTAGNAISFTQAMTLDASGNLNVGATGYSYRVAAVRSSDGIVGYFRRDSGTVNPALTISCNETGNTVGFGTDYAGATSPAMTFSTQGTERARITSGGYFKASNTGTYLDSTGSFHELASDDVDNAVAVLKLTNASYTGPGAFVDISRNTTNNTFYAISYYNRGASAYKFRVADSGDVTNTNGTYGTISDAKMKTDIVDAGSQWSDIKALRFRKFKMKDDPSGLVQLGVVAQEVEQTSPGLVDEHADKDAEGNDLGTTTKSVKTSVLLMKAAVALQEAMARIEKLEAEVAALKGA